MRSCSCSRLAVADRERWDPEWPAGKQRNEEEVDDDEDVLGANSIRAVLLRSRWLRTVRFHVKMPRREAFKQETGLLMATRTIQRPWGSKLCAPAQPVLGAAARKSSRCFGATSESLFWIWMSEVNCPLIYTHCQRLSQGLELTTPAQISLNLS